MFGRLALLCFTALATSASASKLVEVNVYSMSGCPCSAQFAYDFNRTVYSDEELRASIDFKQPWSASAHAPSNTTSCFHGEKECRFEKWLLCALDQGGIDKAFPLELCLDGACDGDFSRMTPCATQYENPDNDELMQSCAAAHGLDCNKLKQCATSSRGDDLLLADAQDFKKVYGLEGLPVVEVAGKVVSGFASCHVSMDKVVNAICAALSKDRRTSDLPKACSSTLSLAQSCDASSMIKRHEGVRDCVYVDTTGHKTIGVGYNLDQSGARTAVESCGINFDDIYSGKTCLTSSQVDCLLSFSLKAAESGARSDVSSYDGLCCNVQNVVTDMVFNLGRYGFGAFHNTISYINSGDWASAAAGLRNSLWCSQVGSRCTEDAADMARGC